jgi:translocation and assembly module TamA
VAATGKRLARTGIAAIALSAVLFAMPAAPLERLDFSVAGGDEDLLKDLRGASLLISQEAQKQTAPQDLFAAARADYGRILNALYAKGYYSGVITIRIDGREAAEIAALDAPRKIGKITVTVDPGPRFEFSEARVAPLARGTELPPEFRKGEPAESGAVADAVDTAVLAWRERGHAKVDTSAEDIVADHARAKLAADIRLNPGPKLRFGRLVIEGAQRMRERRIRKIAGLPEGETFRQLELDRAATRLRRTGIFSSVTLTEAETITAPDLLGITATVVEQKPRRYSFGAEIASLDGLSLTGSWLHRNLLGGGERFKIEGEVTNIGAGSSGIDYGVGITIDRPATLTPDTTAGLTARIDHLDEIDYYADSVEAGLVFSHIFSESLTGRAGLTYEYQRGRDPGGYFEFRNLSLPLGATWDRRDNPTDATKGFYIDAEAKPFLGFGTTDSGARFTLDGRAYRSLGEPGQFVVAARAHMGAIVGSSLLGTPRDELFFSGGGGTVRGHPYRSLGVPITRDSGEEFLIGGTYFLAGSIELRAKVSEKIGVVGFFDAGRVDVDGFFDDSGDWQTGAGLGLRYDTGFGPVRLDVAAPVGGSTGDGVQIYIGLGQSF